MCPSAGIGVANHPIAIQANKHDIADDMESVLRLYALMMDQFEGGKHYL